MGVQSIIPVLSWLATLTCGTAAQTTEIPITRVVVHSSKPTADAYAPASANDHPITSAPIYGLVHKRDEEGLASNSVCGYISSNIHWPWACGESSFCDRHGSVLRCCSTYSLATLTLTSYDTYTTTLRNTYTGLGTETVSDMVISTIYDNCTSWQTCYDADAASSCTESCTDTALVCSYVNYGYCASVYYTYLNFSSVVGSDMDTSIVTTTGSSALAYYCDTTNYGMNMYFLGTWDASNTSTSTYNYSSLYSLSSNTFTPSPVPFTRTQSSYAQQALGGTAVPAQTSTSRAISNKLDPYIIQLAALLGSIIVAFL